MSFSRNLAILVASMAIVGGSLGCGGGGDDDDGLGGNSTAAIGGNVSTAPTASLQRSEKSLLARIAEDVIGFAKEAYAQALGLDGIEVSSGGEADVTDAGGNFDLPDVPTGDISVRLRRGNCDASIAIPDVTSGSVLVLEDVDFTCNAAQPARVTESFEAVVRNKPSSPNGNLNVCVQLTDQVRSRAVKIQDATFEGGTFDDLEEGERIAVTGVREGLGAPSALDAEVVSLLGPAGADPCDPTATQTPDGTQTPEATATPGTPEPTTTATATATATP